MQVVIVAVKVLLNDLFSIEHINLAVELIDLIRKRSNFACIGIDNLVLSFK